jgi:hypothetical protein
MYIFVMKLNSKQAKRRILATKKVATAPKKGSTLNFVPFSDEELA